MVKTIHTLDAPGMPGRVRWVITVEPDSRVRPGRWFVVNVLDDIGADELDELFVQVQMTIAEKQAIAQERAKAAQAIREAAPFEDSDDDPGETEH